jgi:phage-related minor tail protein
MGAYYVLAAFHNLKSFYRWTVPFRAVTFTVFTGSVILGLAPQRFLMVGAWELVGAMATGAALYYEGKQEKEARREPHSSAKDAAPGDGRSG